MATSIEKLQRTVELHYKSLQPFRENGKLIERHYAGPNYGERKKGFSAPVNLLRKATDIHVRHCISSNPKFFVESKSPELFRSAYELELGLNHVVSEMNLKRTIGLCVMDAFFFAGIVKCGIFSTGQTKEIYGTQVDVGQPYVERVHRDDFVYDTTASVLEKAQFMGNRYWLSLEDVQNFDGFNKKVTSKLKADTDLNRISETGEQRSSTIGRASTSNDGEPLYPLIELWDMYLPYEQRLVTYTRGVKDALADRQYSGPEWGNYLMLSLGDVPSAIAPNAPANDWLEVHLSYNRLMSKLLRQAERQKTNLLGPKDAVGDLETIRKLADGVIATSNSADKFKEYNTGGVNNVNFAFVLQLRQLFSWMGNNLETLGGLSPMAETGIQEKLLSAASSKNVAEMQDRVTTFTRQIGRSVAWYLVNDPAISLPLTKRLPGPVPIEIPFELNAERIEGDWIDYNYDIVPYSMQDMTPKEKLAATLEIVQTVLMPLTPMLQSQGKALNVEGLLQRVDRLSNMNVLDDLIVSAVPQQGPAHQPVGTPPQKANVSRREYVRKNVSQGPGMAGQEANMSAMLASDGQAHGQAGVNALIGAGA